MRIRLLALLLFGLPFLASCYTDGDNANSFTSYTDKNTDALILVGLSVNKRVWLFTGVTFVRIDPATGKPDAGPDAVVRVGRSDGDNHSSNKKPTFAVVKAKPGVYALANFYIGSNDYRWKYTGRMSGKTQSFVVRAGRINYVGDYMIFVANALNLTFGRRNEMRRVRIRYRGHARDAAKEALKDFSSVKAPFAAIEAGTATLE